ncbi:bifunctional UDP-N-acetylglucosamine diphosphorylase/glucosamine-1-phosphate N-acetyltransferase GlmU [Desulfovibrio sulfodismutans]|uniref:Bifunctional protein GlmU n=1 Tax=Desulfolutivibrio sulfodismutans TaxID=63561 RepID=A0A7K3NPA3_9BACT|nr:bifunctional UDP-N-acetylglucosamine diphosphorylase/glucosamine-1-phosphate N-acetyltransferase GlmU [Desulfolutivibrio sulfodismutans]NDY58001.1 bifunctional UDP-N-acetylglucosamine diphosphorylase/glucosamine-1-phosphate N-acetyltransferase GlmU [Desulfolutivibrio sulfodismutans]QLA14542.1 bifunctional UDP-N-acetylglucosamine diphosphorylase/glucosamine-1-phosphate N-acetyltransferase GlmU [Desulfolutivibrio sulfodismutans DSM 3696]
MFAGVGGLVLAAGKGTRMHSETPKVLQTILGDPMLSYVLRACAPVCEDRLHVVVGHGADTVRQAFPEWEGRFVVQDRQLGTGHALATALPVLVAAGYGHVLVVNGDMPLLTTDILAGFVAKALEMDSDVAFATIELDQPGAYGRVVRTSDGVRIVEAKDHDPSRHGPATGEINAGLYLLRLSVIQRLVPLLRNENQSGEFYITDLVEMAAQSGGVVAAIKRGRDAALLGVNSPRELSQAEEALRAGRVDDLFDQGVLVRNPGQVRVGPRVTVAPGAEMTGPCELYGGTAVGAGTKVGSHVWIRDCTLAPGCEILPFSHLDGATVGPLCKVGPFARLRAGAVLCEEARVGNFVEVKKSVLGRGVKAGHLTYLGDAEVGAGTNVGAGTITCNYDGKNKHATVIGENAFIGSNTSLVAPVTIGADALIGAGSVITHDVPDGTLAVARGRQSNIMRKRPAS